MIIHGRALAVGVMTCICFHNPWRYFACWRGCWIFNRHCVNALRLSMCSWAIVVGVVGRSYLHTPVLFLRWTNNITIRKIIWSSTHTQLLLLILMWFWCTFIEEIRTLLDLRGSNLLSETFRGGFWEINWGEFLGRFWEIYGGEFFRKT